MFQPSVSVVVPVYNRVRQVAECIQSLLASSYPRSLWELICVDNGSTDGTGAVLRSFGDQIRVVEEQQRGAAAARNAGIHAATGEVIAFTDSDCVVSPDWLAAIVQPLANADVAAVGGRILARQPASPITLFGEIVKDHALAIQYYKPAYFDTANIALRRDLLLEAGLFDVRLLRGQDAELAYRILRDRPQMHFHYCHDAVVWHENCQSLGELMREGFVHGYWGAVIWHMHGDYIQRSLRMPRPERSRVQGAAAPAISERQQRFYGTLFRKSKELGKWMGRRRAAELVGRMSTGA